MAHKVIRGHCWSAEGAITIELLTRQGTDTIFISQEEYLAKCRLIVGARNCREALGRAALLRLMLPSIRENLHGFSQAAPAPFAIAGHV